MTFTAANAALRDLLGELIDQRGDTAATLTGWLSGLEVHYPASPGAHPSQGDRLPDLLTGRGRVHSLLAPDRFLLVGLGGRALDPALSGLLPDGHPRLDVVTSHDGWSDLTAALVRPDGHLAHGWSGHDVPGRDDVATVVEQWTTPGPDVPGDLVTASPAAARRDA